MQVRRIWACMVAIITPIVVACVLATTSAHAEIPFSSPTPPPHLGYGINVRQEHIIAPLFAPLGLEWIKLWEEYEDEPPAERLPYQVLFAIECNGMPANLDDWGDHVTEIAQAGLGRVEAYEIGNEPNLDRFWANAPPDPDQYVQVLQVTYERIKAVDPSAIVVSGGLAPTGRIEGNCNGWNGNNCGAMDEREYASQMLLLGAGDCFDAFGYHPYGFAYPPETDPLTVSNGFAFRGAEVMHTLLEQHGLGHKPLWATEFNWLRDDYDSVPSRCREDYEADFGWMEVSELEQANYITRAFQYADQNWPWMGAMFVWNLDWHNYHTWDCEAARYFSIRKNNDSNEGIPALAYDALATMERRPGYFGPRLAVEPSSLTLLTTVGKHDIFTTTLYPQNVGYRVLTWTATVATGMQVTPTLAITTGLQGESLTVTVDSTGYLTGVFAGAITVTATTTDVLNAPQTVPITLNVAPPPPQLTIIPTALTFLVDVDEPDISTGLVTPINTGRGVLTWTATVAIGMQVTPTLVPTTGLQGEPLTVMVDSTSYPTGTFTGAITVTATTTDVLDTPQTAPVTLLVVPEVYRIYLPVTLRSTTFLFAEITL
jgi:hypothetical protein